MSKRALILVEGQTEERFVKDILAPAFFEYDLYLSPTLLVTKRVKYGANFKGGVTTFGKFENDVRRLLENPGDALVTTLVDYYGLPGDFPGMDTRPEGRPIERVKHVEVALRDHFGNAINFLPFLTLHEFEALLFSSEDALPRTMTDMDKQEKVAAIRSKFTSPEDINERPGYNPSSLILKIFPSYQKILHGSLTANRIGLTLIRNKCRHFAGWLNELEQFATA